MSVSVQDVLKVNVVLVNARLLGTPDERTQFGANTGAIPDAGGLVLADTGGGRLEQTLRFVIPRDRLAVELSSSRLQVAIEYPQTIEAVDLLGGLVASAIEATEMPSPPVSYGFNIELVYRADLSEQHTAFAYLGRLFAADNDLGMGRLAGGSCRMLFDDLDEQDVAWTVALEPRFNDADTGLIFLQLNEHVSKGGEFPAAADVTNKARLLWQRAHGLIDTIDGMVPAR